MIDMRRLRLLAVAMFLVGCEAAGSDAAGTAARSPGASPIADPGPIAFRCPPAGSRASYQGRGNLVFHGADPADPLICLATESGRWRQRALFNRFGLPLEDETAVRQGFGALWPLIIGGTSSFEFAWRTRDGEMRRYAERWRVLRVEGLQIGEEVRRAVVLQRRQEAVAGYGEDFLGTDIHWIDIDTGIQLRRVAGAIRGTVRPGFSATAISVPNQR